MKLDLDEQEVALVLDALSSLPLKTTYNLFNKIMEMYKREQRPQVPFPGDVGTGGTSEAVQGRPS